MLRTGLCLVAAAVTVVSAQTTAPCEGDNCPPPPEPCEDDNCPPPPKPCEGDNCPPPPKPCVGYWCPHPPKPCEGDNCPPPPKPCEGDNCPPPPKPCEGDNCPPPPKPCEGDDCPPPPKPCEGDNCPKKPKPRPPMQKPSICKTARECGKILKDKENVPECPERTKNSTKADFFDETTCCPTCKPKKIVKPAEPENKKGNGTVRHCDKAKMDECKAAIRDCFEGEKATRVEGSCCASCVRPDAKKKLKDIAKRNDKPGPVKNEDGCADKKCGEGEKRCVRALKKETHKLSDALKCVPKKHKKFLIKVKKTLKEEGAITAVKSFLEGATDDEARDVIVEIVNRYCSNPDFAKVCDKYQDFVLRYLVAKVTKDPEKPEEVSVDVDVPVPVEEGERRALLAVLRRLTEEDAMDLVSSAMSNSDELGDEILVEEAVEETKTEAPVTVTTTKDDLDISSAVTVTTTKDDLDISSAAGLVFSTAAAIVSFLL